MSVKTNLFTTICIPSYINQSIDFPCKSTDWFQYGGNIALNPFVPNAAFRYPVSKLYFAFFLKKKTHYQMPNISKLLYKLMLYKLHKNHLQVNGTQNKGQQKK